MPKNPFIQKQHRSRSTVSQGYFTELEPPILSLNIQNYFIEFGAAELSPNLFEVNGEEYEAEILFGTSRSKQYDLKDAARLYKERIPKDCIPFAYLSGGDLLLLDLKSEALKLWLHELFDEYEIRKSKKKLPLFIDNYKDFFKSLRHESGIKDTDPDAEVWIDPEFLKKLNKSK